MSNQTLEESLEEANKKLEEVIKLSEEINRELKKILQNWNQESNILE